MPKYKDIKVRIVIDSKALLSADGQGAQPEPKPEPKAVKPDG